MATRFKNQRTFLLFFTLVLCLFSNSSCGEKTESEDDEDWSLKLGKSLDVGYGGPDPYFTGWGSRKPAILSSDVSWDNLDEYMEKINKTTNILREITGLTAPDFVLPDKFTWAHPMDIIRESGYRSVESVNVTTNDGYILTLWRIKCPRNKAECRPNKNRNPVLLQHGLLMSGADWLCVEADSILPFMLADKGYEVFIGNSRGNVYSRAHVKSNTTHDPDNPNSSYWKFGVHDMATEDLPAVISAIKEMTKTDRINYVGYSMGTTQFFMYISEKPEYKDSIRKMAALAPAVYIPNLQTPLRLLAAALRVKKGILPYVITSLQQLLMHDKDGPVTDQIPLLTHPITLLVQRLLPMLVPEVGYRLGQSSLHVLLCDGSPVVKNRKAFQRSLGHQPAGGSLRTVNHYVQLHKSGLFKKFQFDMDFEKLSPHLKNATKETVSGSVLYGIKRDVPVLVLYGEDDSLVVPEDARETIKAYTGKFCSVPKFNHLDFLVGPDDEVKKMNEKVLKWFGTSSSDWSTEDCL